MPDYSYEERAKAVIKEDLERMAREAGAHRKQKPSPVDRAHNWWKRHSFAIWETIIWSILPLGILGGILRRLL